MVVVPDDEVPERVPDEPALDEPVFDEPVPDELDEPEPAAVAEPGTVVVVGFWISCRVEGSGGLRIRPA